MQISVDDTAVRERFKKLQQSEYQGALTARLENIGKDLREDAKSRCPVRTGALKNSIFSVVTDNECTVGSPLEYAQFVEYGTWKMAAQPFLEPALKEARKRILTEFEDLIKEQLND